MARQHHRPVPVEVSEELEEGEAESVHRRDGAHGRRVGELVADRRRRAAVGEEGDVVVRQVVADRHAA